MSDTPSSAGAQHSHFVKSESTASVLTQSEYDELVHHERKCFMKGDLDECRKLALILHRACPLRTNKDSNKDAGSKDVVSAWACFDLAQLYSIGKAEFSDNELATELYSQACDRKHYRACYNLAMMYALDCNVQCATGFLCLTFVGVLNVCSYGQGLNGVERDQNKAMSLLKNGCEHRHIKSCSRAAEVEVLHVSNSDFMSQYCRCAA